MGLFDPFLTNPVEMLGFGERSTSTLVIETQSGKHQKIELIGRALPFPGMKTPGTMRREKTVYQGNPTATMQVIGPDEGETTLSGCWKDRFIGEGSSDGSAIKLNGIPCSSAAKAVAAMDGFRLGGQIIKLTWGPVARIGLIAEFVPDWLNEHDVSWELKLDWTARDVATPPPAFNVNPPDPTALLAKILNCVAFLTTPGLIPLPPLTLAALAQQLVAVNNAALHVQDIQVSSNSTATSDTTAARAMAAAYRSVVTAARAMGVTIRSAPPADFYYSANPGALGLGLVLSGAGAQRTLLGYVRDISATAAQLCDSIERSVGDTSDLQTSILARANTDLRSISTAFYGTPTHWQMLMTFNGLSSSKLVAGQVVLVPALGSRVGT